jgi:sarcosine oxidase subunit gamma
MAIDTRTQDRRRTLLPESSFAHANGAEVTLEPLPFQALVNLRGDASDRAFLDGVRVIAGVDVPVTPNRRNASGDREMIWLGPDEWLIVAPDGAAAGLETELRERLGNHAWLSVVDVSCNYSGFVLGGTRARDVLAKGCSLDLDAGNFTAAAAVQTVLAQANVLISKVDADVFEIRVRNSFARYLLAWLDDAMAEYRD